MPENKQNLETEQTKINDEKTSSEGAAAAKRAVGNTDADVSQTVKETFNKAKTAAGETAAQIAGQVKEKAVSLLDEQKSHLAAGISSIADSLRQSSEHLREGDQPNQIAEFAGKYGDSLAEQIELVSHYVEDKDWREIAQDAENLARRNPALFVGGAFALGILAARFLKSSGGRRLNIAGGTTDSNAQAIQAS